MRALRARQGKELPFPVPQTTQSLGQCLPRNPLCQAAGAVWERVEREIPVHGKMWADRQLVKERGVISLLVLAPSVRGLQMVARACVCVCGGGGGALICECVCVGGGGGTNMCVYTGVCVCVP